MSEISSEFVDHLGRLSRLELSSEEKERFAEQLNDIVGYVDQLQNLDLKDEENQYNLLNIVAEDAPREESDLCTIPREELLKGVPVHDDNYIVVRAVLDEGEGS